MQSSPKDWVECGSWLDFKSRADQPALVTYELNSLAKVFRLRAVKGDAVYVYREPLWSEDPATLTRIALGETEKGIGRRAIEKRLDCGLAYSVLPKLLKKEGGWTAKLEYQMDPNYVRSFISLMLKVPKEKVTHAETVAIEEERKPETGLMDLERLENKRIIALESIRLLEQQLDEVEKRRRELSEDLDRVSLLESTLQPLKEQYVEKLRETDRAIYRRFGVELEKPKEVRHEPTYPARGVFTVGLLLALIGFLFLFSVEAPLTLKFILGAGFLLVGFSVLISCFARLRRKGASTL
ncbi:MAG: DUF308 domain-containing protein [Candidatus Bathyarchaeia archaeon]